MTLTDFKSKYNLVGSLLENITTNKELDSITLEIDFCYWQQTDFIDGDKETGIVELHFSECSQCEISNHKINSDEIVKVEFTENSIDICVESDITNDYHHIFITALNVEFAEL